MKTHFDHEKLDVYQGAIAFCGWVGEFIATISAKAAAKDQLDRASTSIPLNIAEGNGKFSAKDRAGFSKWHAALLLNARRVWTFGSCESLLVRNRLFWQRSNSSGSYRCSLGYFANSLSGLVFCAKKNRHIPSITITITSGSTSK